MASMYLEGVLQHSMPKRATTAFVEEKPGNWWVRCGSSAYMAGVEGVEGKVILKNVFFIFLFVFTADHLFIQTRNRLWPPWSSCRPLQTPPHTPPHIMHSILFPSANQCTRWYPCPWKRPSHCCRYSSSRWKASNIAHKPPGHWWAASSSCSTPYQCKSQPCHGIARTPQ